MLNYKAKNAMLCMFLAAIICSLSLGAVMAQDAAQDDAKQDDAKLQFSFEDTEWKVIIEWFAKEADLTLQPIDEPPPGTFRLTGPEKYTVKEGLDVINHALQMRGYWLVRNKQMLILMNAEKELPAHLIEIVPVSELDNRGKYEVMKTVFSLEGIDDIAAIREEVEPLIGSRHRDYMAVMVGAQEMLVQETGATLRFIRDMLEKTKKNTATSAVQVVELQHVSQEDLLVVARKMLQIPEDRFVSIDGSLSIVPEPLGLKLYVSGTPEMMKKFMALVKQIDVPFDGEAPEPEALILKVYPVRGNLELAQKILDTILAGRPEMRMSPDEDKGALVIRATASDHELVQTTLDSIEKGNTSFDIITPNVMDPDELAEQLMSVLGQSVLDDAAASTGPTIVPDAINNRILVRGTPVEVEMVKEMAAKLDTPREIPESERTNVRVISMTDRQKEKAVGMLGDLLSSSGMPNRINFVFPKGYDPNNQKPWYMGNQDVDAAKRGVRNIRSTNQDFNNQNGANENAGSKDGVNDQEEDQGGDDSQSDNNQKGSQDSDTDNPPKSTSVLPGKFKTPVVYTTFTNTVVQQDDETSTGANKSVKTARQEDEDIQTIPGSDVEIKITEYGIVLRSSDLDALDELEFLIQEHITGLSDLGAPSVFWLKHRTATYMKTKLDEILGQGDSGGGGGGGLGSLLGGGLQNMVGGAAGQMLGGLMGGGGGGSSAAALETEDVVTIVADDTTNSLLITATENDLALINDLIELYDRDSSLIDPDTIGATYVVPLLYRDATEVEAILKTQLADVIKSDGGQGGGGGDGAARQMQQMQQMMRALTQGNRGRGGGGGSEEEKPKVRIGIDEAQNAIVITGPSDLAERVKKTVEILDIPNPYGSTVELGQIPGGIDAASIQQALQAALGPKVQINMGGQDGGQTQNSTNPTQNRGGATQGGNNNAAAIQDAMRQRIQQMMQQGGGNRGGGNRGGGNRGGGNRGGGGRGGR